MAAEEIIIRLNGINDSKYSSKIAYDIFKALGRIYERKYQKDVQQCLGVLDPIVQIIDSVFIELSNKQDMMKKSIQNSFMMADAESNYLESLTQLSGPKLKQTLDTFSKFRNNSFPSVPELLLDTTEEIKKLELFKSESHAYSDILYSLTAAKRKIERELDWTLCALDKSIFPLIRQNNGNQMCRIASRIDSIDRITVYDPKSVDLSNCLNKKLKEFTDNTMWKNIQNLSLLIKTNSKSNNALYIDSKLVPDANDLDKVLRIPKYFKNEKINAIKLAKKMKVKPRMALYYLDAAEMLGIIKREGDYYRQTDLVKKLDSYSDQDKNEIIHAIIQELPIVKAFSLYLETHSKTRFTTKDVAKFLEYSTDLSPTTARRRASTITSWLKTKNIIKPHNDAHLIKEHSEQTYLSEFMKTAIKNQ